MLEKILKKNKRTVIYSGHQSTPPQIGSKSFQSRIQIFLKIYSEKVWRNQLFENFKSTGWFRRDCWPSQFSEYMNFMGIKIKVLHVLPKVYPILPSSQNNFTLKIIYFIQKLIVCMYVVQFFFFLPEKDIFRFISPDLAFT